MTAPCCRAVSELTTLLRLLSPDGAYAGVNYTYYGIDSDWFRPREQAENKMFDLPIGSNFTCQFDPSMTDPYRYIVLPGSFHTNDYLIWTIVRLSLRFVDCSLLFVVDSCSHGCGRG